MINIIYVDFRKRRRFRCNLCGATKPTEAKNMTSYVWGLSCRECTYLAPPLFGEGSEYHRRMVEHGKGILQKRLEEEFNLKKPTDEEGS